MVSGPVLLKISEKVGFSYLWGQTNEKKTEKLNGIGQTLVSRALDDTKKMPKAGADIFSKSGLEKP